MGSNLTGPTWEAMIKALAEKTLLHVVRHPSGMYSCNTIYKGKHLSGYAMQAEIRLRYMSTYTPRVVCWGWTTYKDICKRNGLDWRQCVYVTRPEDLDGAVRVLVDPDSLDNIANPRREEIRRALALIA